DQINASSVNRGLRHDAVFGRDRVLRDGDSACPADRCNSVRTVTIGAAQNNTDGVLAIDGGHRPEHNIDGWPRKTNQSRMRQLNPAMCHQQMLVRWSNIDRARRDGLAVLGFLDPFTCLSRQQHWQLALMTRIEVLHNYNRGKFRV